MLSTTLPLQLETHSTSSCPAHELGPSDRKDLGLRALLGEPVTNLAKDAKVSRKFVYEQKSRADQALDNEFQPSPSDNEVLFYLPVTKRLIQQIILALVLICRASLHGVRDFFREIFDYEISIGTIHNVIHGAAAKSKEINSQEKLSKIDVALFDEIFQASQPILVGVCPKSTYCFLLSLEEHRDGTTWGVRILELEERGFSPDYAVADSGQGLRAGLAEACPGTPCWGDHFHILHEFTEVITYHNNQAYRAMEARYKFASKREHAKLIRTGELQVFEDKLNRVKAVEKNAMSLADDLCTLAQWLRIDVFAQSGPPAPIRRELFDFIVAELKSLEGDCPKRIRALRIALENQREDLLAFADKLDEGLGRLAQKWQTSMIVLRDLLKLSACERGTQGYYQLEDILRKRFGDRRHAVRHDLEKLQESIVKASSLVENYNSRLRNYFELRKILGHEYLELLRFFLNNRPYPRSRIAERKEKTPAELLHGRDLPSWLEQLGYQHFKQAA